MGRVLSNLSIHRITDTDTKHKPSMIYHQDPSPRALKTDHRDPSIPFRPITEARHSPPHNPSPNGW